MLRFQRSGLGLATRRISNLLASSRVQTGVNSQVRMGHGIALQQVRESSTIDSVCFMLWKSCNYNCKFCWHPDKGRDAPFSFAKAALGVRLLRKSGVCKINFSGGERAASGQALGRMQAAEAKLDAGTFH